jgi:large subunit ribosomal protein L20
MRGLFISRITAAVRPHGTSYSKFMHGLKVSRVELNRKMLSQLAIVEPAAFTQIINTTRV